MHALIRFPLKVQFCMGKQYDFETKKRPFRILVAALYVAFPSDEDEQSPITGEEGVLSFSLFVSHRTRHRVSVEAYVRVSLKV
jgi:hypothetical protein